MRAALIALAISCCGLGGCVSVLHQQWLDAGREYDGYKVQLPLPGQAKGELYCCGDAWYLPAVRCRAEVRHEPFVQPNLWESRRPVRLAPVKPEEPLQIVYHKIPPTLVQRIQGGARLSELELSRALCEAGGEWVDTLPPNAKKVPTACAASWALAEEKADSHTPWYAYPAAGVTLVCVDVPVTVLLAVTSPLIYATQWACEQVDIFSMKADMKNNLPEILPLVEE